MYMNDGNGIYERFNMIDLLCYEGVSFHRNGKVID